jgi:hypothetical protein
MLHKFHTAPVINAPVPEFSAKEAQEFFLSCALSSVLHSNVSLV